MIDWQHTLSSVAGMVTNWQCPRLQHLIIKAFIKAYGVDMSEAQHASVSDFATFQSFFTRALKTGARPLPSPSEQGLVSPADGRLLVHGKVTDGQMLQIKGHSFSAAKLLANDEIMSKALDNMSYATIYLSPKDYHRVHAPLAGRINRLVYVPGRLFPVKPSVLEKQHVFSANERLILEMETAEGPCFVVMVGALIVGQLITAWGGPIARHRTIQTWTLGDGVHEAMNVHRGDCLGAFGLGSTVVVFYPNTFKLANHLTDNASIKMGEMLALPS